jgi:hypothetical protein
VRVHSVAGSGLALSPYRWRRGSFGTLQVVHGSENVAAVCGRTQRGPGRACQAVLDAPTLPGAN